MGKKTDLGNLGVELSSELQKYASNLAGNVDKEALKVAKETAKEIKVNAMAAGLQRRPRYVKGWTYTKQGVNYVVRNRTDYQLTHLLENGHEARDGSFTRAFPHIAPAEKNAIEKFERLVNKAIEES